jgi:hypothetical protein
MTGPPASYQRINSNLRSRVNARCRFNARILPTDLEIAMIRGHIAPPLFWKKTEIRIASQTANG